MVQTIKRAIKVWSIDKGDFFGFLQKVLLTYRTAKATGRREGSPAKLMFGRDIRHPLIQFSNHELIYTSKPGEPAETCELVVQNSPRTVYVTCNGTTRLAHLDQLREKPIVSTDSDSDDDINVTSNLVKVSKRVKKPPAYLNDYITT